MDRSKARANPLLARRDRAAREQAKKDTEETLVQIDGKVMNLSDLRKSWLEDSAEKANATVSKVLANFGLTLPPGWTKFFAELSAICYFITESCKTVKDAVLCVYKFFSQMEQKRVAEKNEVSIRARSEKISVRDVSICGPLKYLPAPECILVKRDRKTDDDEEEGPFRRGTIVQVGYGFFVPAENKFVPHIYEVNDRVVLRGDGEDVYLKTSSGKVLYATYYVSDVVGVEMP